MSDLIDRYAAIKLIHSLYPSAPIMQMNRKWWEKKYKPYIEAEKMLEMFPSAKPEIIRCKDCKHWNTGNCNCPDIRVDCSDYYVGDLVTEEDFYCGFSKRREE